ncbi:MAG: MFS transporter [Candidatus Aminicenantes bacterium]|nr:MFS transporter [Candidatus Aminicenantes bacterium]
MPANKYRWIILLMVYVCMLVYAFTLQSLPPVLTLIIKELRLTHAQAGSLMSLFTFPAIFFAIGAGLISDRWGSRKVGLISFLLATMGTLLLLLGRTFPVACLGRFLAGTGAVIISIVASKALALWFQGRELGTAMGIYNTAMPVGTIICFTTFGKLGESLGWRAPFFITAFVCIAGLAVFLILYKSAPDPLHEMDRKEGEMAGLFSRLTNIGILVWLAGLCWLWFNAAVISFSTFAPDFFVSRGKSIEYAGFLTSLLMLGSLVLSPVIGRVIDKLGRNEIFIGVGGLILMFSLFLVSKSTHFLFPMTIMAIAAGLIPTPVFSYLSKVLPHRDMGLGFGILNTVSGVGMFFGPYVSGFIRDKTGSYETTFLFLALLSVLIPVTAVILRIKMKKT